MTEGKLQKKMKGGTVEATVGPDGWSSPDAAIAGHLNAICPVGGTEAGVGWVRAFWRAVDALGADVVREPKPD